MVKTTGPTNKSDWIYIPFLSEPFVLPDCLYNFSKKKDFILQQDPDWLIIAEINLFVTQHHF